MSVFISYATDDKPRIRKVIDELKSRKMIEEDDKIIETSDVFVPGSSVRAQVREAIEAASKVVVLWSGAGAEADWVNYETGMAEALGKPILFVVTKGEVSRVPRDLADSQIIELENIR